MVNKKRTLYKFYSFNWHKDENNKDLSFFIDGLENNYLFCQDIHMLNDAFENKAVFKCKLVKGKKDLKEKKKIMISFVKKLKRMDEDEIGFTVKKIKHYDEAELNDFIVGFAALFKESINSKERKGAKICCFSKNNDDLLMWGHYGCGMTGVCVKYDAEDRDLLDVVYKDTLNEIDVWDHFSGKIEYVDSLHSCKGRAWVYEDEVRLVISSKYESKVKIKENDVLEICFGCKASVRDVNAVFDAISNWEIKPSFSVAFPGGQDFKVEFKKFSCKQEILNELKKFASSRQIASEINFY